MDFGIVARDMIPEVWSKCLPIIKAACEYSGNIDTPDDTFNLLMQERKYIWLAVNENGIKGVVLTTIEQYPLKKVCSIDVCTGDELDTWIDNISTIENWAKDNGCSKMFNMARCGYEKKLKGYGYNKTHVFLEKDLEDE